MGKCRTRLFSQKYWKRKFKSVFKGSLRDPFLYLGLTAAVLFYFIPFVAGSSSGLSSQQADAELSLAVLANAAPSSKDHLSLTDTARFVPESSELVMIENISLKSALPTISVSPQSLATLSSVFDYNEERQAITEYIVSPGDTVKSIAEEFNISLDTLLWANDLTKSAILKPGQELVVPSVTGIIHHVKSGDTVSDIALRYKGKAEDIIAFNSLNGENDIYIGDILIVPNGVMPSPSKRVTAPSTPVTNSYFICPIAGPCNMTQGLHWYNAVDFSNGKCGGPVYASAAGVVQRVRLTNSTSRDAFYGAGNTVTVLHPNGIVTSYGHIATSLVQSGQQVSQGQTIALVGGKPGTPGAGLSTGCHVHFGVTGARNPFAR